METALATAAIRYLDFRLPIAQEKFTVTLLFDRITLPTRVPYIGEGFLD